MIFKYLKYGGTNIPNYIRSDTIPLSSIPEAYERLLFMEIIIKATIMAVQCGFYVAVPFSTGKFLELLHLDPQLFKENGKL